MISYLKKFYRLWLFDRALLKMWRVWMYLNDWRAEELVWLTITQMEAQRERGEF